MAWRKVAFVLIMGLLAAAPISFIFLSSCEAEVITVGQGSQHATIQAAIDAASVGDTVYINSGTYHENLYINKTLTITGNDSVTTVIDGTGQGSVIVINTDWVNISGITVTGSGTNSNDAGLLLSGVFNCTVQNVTIKGNRYGIFTVASGGNKFYNNNFIDNMHPAYDSGINTWSLDVPVGGNFWDDQELEDADGNGLMDTPYSIPGGAARDRNPWSEANGWASYDTGDKFTVDAVSVIVIGISVVFMILTILWGTTHITGVIMDKYGNKKPAPKDDNDETEKVAAVVMAIKTRGD